MRFDQYLALERQEMMRHKWIESEKAGRDVGTAAYIEWAEKHADGFHRYITEVMGEKVEWTPASRN